MRRYLSLFIMLLLALRGLAAGAMVMDSPAPHIPSATHATAVTAVVTQLSHDMHGMSEQAHEQQMHRLHMHHQPTQAADMQHCGTSNTSDCGSHNGSQCTNCGLCHTTLGQAQPAFLAGISPAHTQPFHEARRFISVVVATQIKPPISGF